MADRPPHPDAKARWLALICLMFAACFAALGVWQVERRAWKHALIARVQARVHASPTAAPGPPLWRRLTRENAEYRRVTLRGRFLPCRESLVRTVTDYGPGSWVMVPLVSERGFVVQVNRGFLPDGVRLPRLPCATGSLPVTVTGALRLSESGGLLLRNDPARGRWATRDVVAMGRPFGKDAAPWFIDAEAGPDPRGWPRGGLTVVTFSDNHLVYALTWFALALLSVAGAWRARAQPPTERTPSIHAAVTPVSSSTTSEAR